MSDKIERIEDKIELYGIVIKRDKDEWGIVVNDNTPLIAATQLPDELTKKISEMLYEIGAKKVAIAKFSADINITEIVKEL